MNMYDGFLSLAADNGTVAYGSTTGITPTANVTSVSTMNSTAQLAAAVKPYTDKLKQLDAAYSSQDDIGDDIYDEVCHEFTKIREAAKDAFTRERTRITRAIETFYDEVAESENQPLPDDLQQRVEEYNALYTEAISACPPKFESRGPYEPIMELNPRRAQRGDIYKIDV